MTKDLSKKSLFRLLDGFTSEREIKKYLQRFESDDFRFAVIKVGGAIATDDLENLTDSISLLHEVGLCPIIIHGCGPKLTSVLNEKNIGKIKMPNVEGFLLPDPRPDIANLNGKPCMKNCVSPTKIIGKARDIDVTPEDQS